MQGGSDDSKGKKQVDNTKLEKISNISKPTSTNEKPESSTQGEKKEVEKKDNNGKLPYCYRCLTKGHAMKDCDAEMYCEICVSKAHITDRCQRYRAARLAATPCGYAVDGLEFYYISHNAAPKQHGE